MGLPEICQNSLGHLIRSVHFLYIKYAFIKLCIEKSYNTVEKKNIRPRDKNYFENIKMTIYSINIYWMLFKW